MMLFSKIFRMFVTLDTLIINQDATNIENKSGTKKKGRRTVASTAVFSRHRFEVSSSDLPPLFNNQNLKVMLDTKDESNLSVLRKNWTVAELQVSYKPKTKTGVNITSSYDAYQVFRKMWDDTLINIQEQFCAIFMNQANEVIGFRVITTGKLNSSTVDIQLLLSCALLSRAAGIIVAHNHPSGNLKTTTADKNVTWKIKEVTDCLEVNLLDHLVITDKDYMSFCDNGIIFKSN